MKAFAYEAPQTEREVLECLSVQPDRTAVLAGGTDLVGMMKKLLVTPERLVSLKDVASLHQIEADADGVRIGAMVTLEDVLESSDLSAYAALRQAIAAMANPQMQAQGTLGGELCQRPRCWYFRSGHGLTADMGRMVVEGDSRYHAILGNSGPAKFVSASRLAPALIALGARARLIGPRNDDETIVPLAEFFQTPGSRAAAVSELKALRDVYRENVLRPGQIVSHISLPPIGPWQSGAYEVQHGSGPDFPLVAAAAALRLEGNRVREARLAMGQVAPVPWDAAEAAEMLLGHTVDAELAYSVGFAAVAHATPLKDNGYKVQLARVAVKRAILRAAGLPTGGLDDASGPS